MIYNILMVGFGGAIGSILRYLTTESLTKYCKILAISVGKFPIGTFAVNIIGSLIAGILYFFIIKKYKIPAIKEPIMLTANVPIGNLPIEVVKILQDLVKNSVER
jgi:fluoride ion exporter CrcB/FEX